MKTKLFRGVITVTLGLTMALGVGVGITFAKKNVSPVYAAETIFYTLDGTDSSQGNNNYASESDVTQNAIGWKVTANTTINPWRIGGKSITGVDRTVYSTNPLETTITKVVLQTGTSTLDNVNSTKLIVASDSNFSSVIEEVSVAWAASSTLTYQTQESKSWTDAYYKFVFNVTKTANSNAYCQFVNAKFYYDNGGAEPTYSVTYNDTDATGGTVPTDSNEYHTGDSVNVAGNSGSLVRTGYIWSGWSINANGSGTAYGPSYTAVYAVESDDINFYPIWVREPTPLPESGSIVIDPTILGSYGTDVAYSVEEENTPDSLFNFKCTQVTKATGSNTGKIQFKASVGTLYSTTPLSYLRSVTVTGDNISDATITYGTEPNGGCTESSIGTRNTYFKISNSAGYARYWNITITYSLEDPEALTGLVIASGADSVRKTYDDGESFDPTGLVINAEWNDSLDAENNVLNDVVWTPNPLTAGTTEVTGTYTHATGSETVSVSGLSVTAPNIIIDGSSNAPSGLGTETNTENLGEGKINSSGVTYQYYALAINDYNNVQNLEFNRAVSGAYFGNKESYGKFIRRVKLTLTSDNFDKFTVYKGNSPLSEANAVSPSGNGNIRFYDFHGDYEYFKLKLTTTGTWVNISSVEVFFGDNVPVIDSVVASVKSGTYYAGTTLSSSDFDITVNWTEGKAATHPTEGFSWTVNGVLNGTLSERNDNKVAVTYEGITSDEFDVVGSPAPAKEIIESTCQTQATLSYHYSRDDHLVTDTLTRALTEVPEETNYVSWNNKSHNTAAVYAGRSAGKDNTIQLNSNNNDKGVITTTSGGKAKSVSLVWNSGTSDGRVINVYGKNTAYSSPADLYGENAGTLIGTISKGTNTSLSIDGDYAYIALRSNGSAIYLDSIQIEWATAAPTFEYSDIQIQFGGYLSQELWNNLNNSSTIVEYGILLSTESFLHTDDPNDDESLKLYYDLADQVNVKKFYKEVDGNEDLPPVLLAAEHDEISEDYYVWRLFKGVSSLNLTEQYVVVLYIKTANGDLVFMNQIKKSVKDLAGDMLPGVGNDYADGSLYNLAHLGE